MGAPGETHSERRPQAAGIDATIMLCRERITFTTR